MWLDDRYWLPVVLGTKREKGDEEQGTEGEGEAATTAAAKEEANDNVVGEFFFKASSGPGSKIMTKHELRAVPLSGLPPLPSW